MFPYKTSFELQRNRSTPLYLQLANQFIQLIKEQILVPETKLPSSRSLATLLEVHRKTIVACYDELLLQGWVESIPKKGTYIHANLPILKQQEFLDDKEQKSNKKTNFDFEKNELLERKTLIRDENWTVLDDGTSDVRLTPLEEIARTYRRITTKKNSIEA
ncbi:MAG: GntR family transcriptional regulator, partial [Flavobacteriaceae bacterium]|nr:GntR family transcriptional regulator [Flavobacteriaceae bacterium]